MGNKEVTLESLKEALKKTRIHLRSENVNETENLFESGKLDSLTLIQFVLALENEYGLVFNYDDITLENFKTLQNVTQLLKEKYGR